MGECEKKYWQLLLPRLQQTVGTSDHRRSSTEGESLWSGRDILAKFRSVIRFFVLPLQASTAASKKVERAKSRISGASMESLPGRRLI